MSPEERQRRLAEVANAIRRRDSAEARRLLDPLLADPVTLFLLAQACHLEGDRAGERQALDRVLTLHPRHVGALLMKGDLLIATGQADQALAPYRTALTIAGEASQRGESIPPELGAELRRASDWLQADIVGRMAAVDDALVAAGFEPGRRSEQIDEALAILRGEAPVQLQQPSNFYFPGLPQRSFYDRREFDWAVAMEERTPTIKAELNNLIAGSQAEFEPYVPQETVGRQAPNAHLAGDRRWSAFHLLHNGHPVSNHADCCPETMAALKQVPLVQIGGRAPMALFSMLQPGAHIRPHHGLFNFRLICHLPLIVPQGCTLRVGNQARDWCEGELLIFDDSMEHEAWNRSAEKRVVLIFEIWRPEISEADRSALTVLLEAAKISSED